MTVMRLLARSAAALTASLGIAHAQIPVLAAPPPVYVITENTLGIGGPNFTGPQAAAAHIAAAHLKWPWPNGGINTYCMAAPGVFTAADFSAGTSPVNLSAYTGWKSIKRDWGVCTAWQGSMCLAATCVPDATAFQYRMRAVCPNGFKFDGSGGKARCECTAGQELAKRADGNWACTTVCTPRIDRPDCYRHDLTCPAGNPVLPGIATKVQSEVDYEGAGAHPLSFRRSFRSNGARPWVAPGGWSHWVHNWGRRVETYPDTGWYSSRAYVIREDASQLIYGTQGTGTWTTTQIGDGNVLTETRDSNGTRTGFNYRVWADDSNEVYDTQGRLIRVVQRNGWTNTLTYSGVFLVSVRNHFGRELKLSYDPAGRLRELLPPGATAGAPPGLPNSPIRYGHEEPDAVGPGVPTARQLTSVTWQDGHRRRYHYENAQFPGFMTGISDELGVRIGTYGYDAYGRVEREFGPGGSNDLRFRYGTNTAEVIDYSNGGAQSATYTFESAAGVVRPVATSAPCPMCGTSQARTVYTGNGDVARSVGHNGKITFFSYDTKGRETERAVFAATYNQAITRPALSLAEHVTSTQWHQVWRLRVQVAEPGKVSTLQYDAKGMPTGQSWTATTDATGAAKFNATRTGNTYATSRTYSPNGLETGVVDRTNGIETQRWTQAYNAAGDLTSVVNVTAGNLTGQATAYDSHGRMLSGTTDAGVVISRQYSPRGFITGSVVGSESSTYTQNAVGLSTQVLMPDGQALQYLYDTSHRLTDVRLNGVSITPSMLASADYPQTSLRKLVARFRDSLGRVGDALMRPAHAQAAGGLLRRVIPIPGRPMPGQPEYDPRSDLIRMAPMSDLDKAALRLGETTARDCDCKPDGGYDQPKFTMVSFAHLLFSGHLSPRFSRKSYFAPTENVGQTLVDEVIRHADGPPQLDRGRMVVRATLSRPLGSVGFTQRSNGVVVPTNRVRLVYEASDCRDSIRARNEVVTMFPE